MKKFLLFLMVILMMLTGCTAKKEVRQHNPDRIIIALLDTGVSTKAIKSDHLLKGFNYVMQSTDTEDLINHGTAVASAVLGCDSAEVTAAAPGAYIVPLVIVTKKDGQTVTASAETLARAICESVDVYNADIINVSLGIQSDNVELREAIEYADEKGVAVISAVGNDGDEGEPYYPAAYETVLAVGSCDKDGNKSSFSQSGADVMAQGENLMLASRSGAKYGVKGTSFAAGFVSAYAAKRLAEKPRMTTEKLFAEISEKAVSSDGLFNSGF